MVGTEENLVNKTKSSFKIVDSVDCQFYQVSSFSEIVKKSRNQNVDYCLVVNQGDELLTDKFCYWLKKIEKRIDLAYVYFKLQNDKQVIGQPSFDLSKLILNGAFRGPILFKTKSLANFTCLLSLNKIQLLLELALLGQYGYYCAKKCFNSRQIDEQIKDKNFIKANYNYLIVNIDFLKKKWQSSIPLLKRLYRHLPLNYRRLIKIFFYRLIKVKYLFKKQIKLEKKLTGPKISIIVPVYNHPQYLKACFDSALNQSYENFELILVDDFSPDSQVKQILKQYESHVKVKVFYNQKNLHVSKTMNKAILNADGKYIAFLDCDDELYPYSLQEVVSYIQKQENEPVYISSKAAIIDKKGKTIFFWQRPKKPKVLDNMWASHLKVLNKDLFLRVGLHDLQMSGIQDYDLALKTDERLKIDYLDKYLYKYREHEGTVTLTQLAKQYQRTDLLQYRSLFRRYIWAADQSKPELKTLIIVLNKIAIDNNLINQIKPTTNIQVEIKPAQNVQQLNELINKTTCQYIYLAPSNFCFGKNWLEHLLNKMHEDFNCAAVSSCLIKKEKIIGNGGFYQDGQFLFYDRDKAINDLSAYEAKKCDWLPFCGTLYKTKLLKIVKIHDLDWQNPKVSRQLKKQGCQLYDQVLSKVNVE